MFQHESQPIVILIERLHGLVVGWGPAFRRLLCGFRYIIMESWSRIKILRLGL
jgi:hypothetical protein